MQGASSQNHRWVVTGDVAAENDNLKDFYMLDLSNMVWTDLTDVSGTLPAARSSAGMVWLGSKLYVFGGLELVKDCATCDRVRRLLNDMHVFDPITGWTELEVTGTPPPPTKVFAMSAVGSKIYLPIQNAMYVFDPASLEWTDLSPSVVGTAAAFQSGKAAWIDGRFFVFDSGEQSCSART